MPARFTPTKRALRAAGLLALPFFFLLTLTASHSYAESVSAAGASSATGTARLNVAVVVPKIAALSIGAVGTAIDAVTFTVSATGTAGNTNRQQATGANANWSGATAPIDTAQFNLTGVPPADGSHPSPFSPPFGIGSGTQTGIVGTLNGVGAATTIPVTVAVTSTLSTVSLTASVSGSNLTSGGNTIPYTQISASSSSTNLPSPVIPASGSGAARTISGCDVSCSGAVNRSATWTYTYANTATVNNAGTYTGQISYTATSP